VESEQLSPVTLARLPIMPLASTVLFPGTVLPLHVTDRDTIALIEDALALDGVVGVVMVDEATGPSRGRPALQEVGCAGRIIHSEKLPNGPCNVLIQGVQRIRLHEEIRAPGAYRRFRTELVPLPTEDALGSASRELGRLESCIMSLRSALEDRDEQLGELLRSTPDPVQLADVLAAAVIQDTALQQRLLAAQDVGQRLRMLIDGLADVMVREGEPPKEAQMN
jgi:Lon protease-like protein